MALLPEAPAPRIVLAPDGVRLATYDTGPADTGPADTITVLAVHGFASSAYGNWVATGWTRDLIRAGARVLAFDQRGHGRSDKPHDPAAYTMAALVADVQAVLDAYLLDDVAYAGYSLGARVGWHTAVANPQLIRRAVLGGIPDGDPLTRFDVGAARAAIAGGPPVTDRLTRTYLDMAAGVPGNDLIALVALVEGMRGGAQPDPAHPPRQPLLLATGSDDPILPGSRALAAAAPDAVFLEVPRRDHFSAPPSRSFRDSAVAFLTERS